MRISKIIGRVVVFAAIVGIAFPAFAHPGRTDGSGGHTCRTSCAKWGLTQNEYHKHNAGGYTNSKGQQFDKKGNPVGSATVTSEPIPSSTPKPLSQPATAPVTTPVVSEPKPSPTPAEEISGEVLGTTEEEEITPPSPTPIPPPSPSLSPTPTTEPDVEDGSGAGAGLVTIAVLGGGGYYLFRRLRRKS